MMLLCRHCIEAMRSHGEDIYKGKMVVDAVEAEATDTTCDFCDEPDDLYECK